MQDATTNSTNAAKAAVTYPVEMGYMTASPSPLFERSNRGRIWAAVITRDAIASDGLARTFLARGRGEFLYSVDRVALGDAIEFGAEYTSRSGKAEYSLVSYHVAAGLRSSGIDLVAYPTAREAIKAGAALVHQPEQKHHQAPRPGRRVRALVEEVQE